MTIDKTNKMLLRLAELWGGLPGLFGLGVDDESFYQQVVGKNGCRISSLDVRGGDEED